MNFTLRRLRPIFSSFLFLAALLGSQPSLAAETNIGTAASTPAESCERDLGGNPTVAAFDLLRMLKKLYKTNTWSFSLSFEESRFGYHLRVKTSDGQYGGVSAEGPYNGIYLSESSIPEKLQGKGFGQFLYLALAKIIYTRHGIVLHSTRNPSAQATKMWISLEKNGWAEFVPDPMGRFRFKRDVLENNFSDLADFVEKRSTTMPPAPSLWQSWFGQPPAE